MRVPNDVHLKRPWLIAEIAPDFELLDVWALPAYVSREDFDAFLRRIAAVDPTASGPLASRVLFRVRESIGRMLGWDHPNKQRRIPGTDDPSLLSRVPRALRGTADDLPVSDRLRRAGATPLYRTDDECALEVANDTVHGVLHFSLPDPDGGAPPHLAIYVKPHGLLGRVYLTAIAPFRHLIVYPALMREISRTSSQPGATARRS